MKDEIKVKYSELFWNSKKVPASGLWALLQSDKEVYYKLVSLEAKIEELEDLRGYLSVFEFDVIQGKINDYSYELAELVKELNIA